MVVAELVRQGKTRRGRALRRARAAASRPARSARKATSSPATSTCRRCSRSRSTTASTRAPGKRSASRPATRPPSRPSTSCSTRFRRQLQHFVDVKMRGNNVIERLYAACMPAPFLSLHHRRLHREGPRLQRRRRPLQHALHHAGRARARTADSLSAIKYHVFDRQDVDRWRELLTALARRLRRRTSRCASCCSNKTPKYGNDDEYADAFVRRVCRHAVPTPSTGGANTTRRRPTTSTTCPPPATSTSARCAARRPTAARPGRRSRTASRRSQGADRNGPTAVIRSAAQMDHARSGGTLLNQKFTPSLLEGDDGTRPAGAPGARRTSSWTATTSSSTW